MNTSSFLSKIQVTLDKKTPLYLEKFDSPEKLPDNTLLDFILNLIVSYTTTNKTFDLKTKSQYEKIVRRRSISDIYRICKFYFYNVTLEEVLVCLAKLWKQKKIGYFYCNHSESRVWMEYEFYKTHTVNPMEYAEPDEFGISPNMIKELSELKY